MRRIIFITLGTIIGSIALLAGYVMFDYDPDDISPVVDAPSYLSIFEDAVQQKMKKSYASLDERGKQKALTEIAASRESDPAREVALYRLRELADKEAALGAIKKNLESLNDQQYEVAIASLAGLGTPKSRAYLDSLYAKLNADPAAHTPLGDYRQSSLTISRADPDLNLAFQEQSRLDADYATSKVREISLFFPTGAEYLMSVPNVDDVLEDFNDSRFVNALDNSPVENDIWTLPLLRTIASLRARLDETMGPLAPFFSPEKLFKDQLMIGKYKEEYLIVSFKDKNVTVAETMIGIFSGLGRDFGINRWNVDGNEIAAVRNRKSGKTLNYSIVGPYFVVATDTALITNAVHTFAMDRKRSIAIDPLFARSFSSIDESGKKEVLFLWTSPTEYFAMVGSQNPAARRLAVVARALGKSRINNEGSASATAVAASFPGAIGTGTMSGEDPSMLWRYIVDVRSVGKNRIDSLARLAKMDVGKQIFAYFAPSMALGYSGIEFLPREYGYSRTAFNLQSAIPLRNAPPRYDSTLMVFLSRITSLVYKSEMSGSTRLWIATDTTTNDSLLMERKLQPSFAVIDGRTLVIASTPLLLRSTVGALPVSLTSSGNAGYFNGRIRVDSLASNATNYLKSYLNRTDQYTPEEINSRMNPLRAALALYDRVEWNFREEGGLRRGEGKLVAKK